MLQEDTLIYDVQNDLVQVYSAFLYSQLPIMLLATNYFWNYANILGKHQLTPNPHLSPIPLTKISVNNL